MQQHRRRPSFFALVLALVCCCCSSSLWQWGEAEALSIVDQKRKASVLSQSWDELGFFDSRQRFFPTVFKILPPDSKADAPQSSLVETDTSSKRAAAADASRHQVLYDPIQAEMNELAKHWFIFAIVISVIIFFFVFVYFFQDKVMVYIGGIERGCAACLRCIAWPFKQCWIGLKMCFYPIKQCCLSCSDSCRRCFHPANETV